MNLNRIIMVVMNVVIRRLINMAINFGMRAASRYGSAASRPGPATPPDQQAGGDVRAQQVDAARRARIAARNMRRLGR